MLRRSKQLCGAARKTIEPPTDVKYRNSGFMNRLQIIPRSYITKSIAFIIGVTGFAVEKSKFITHQIGNLNISEVLTRSVPVQMLRSVVVISVPRHGIYLKDGRIDHRPFVMNFSVAIFINNRSSRKIKST